MFKRFLTGLLPFLLLLSSCASPQVIEQSPQTVTEAWVVEVVDGDTIKVQIDSQIYSVRYIGIDTPETVHPDQLEEPFGKEASAANETLVGGQRVRLEKDVSETDKYDRLLRYVYVGDIFVNAQLVDLGWAESYAYPPDTKYQDLFDSLETQAKADHRGMWEEETPPPPPPTGKYVGSVNSDKYHYPSCEWAKKISESNRIWFNTAEDARSQGYVPCKVCNPP